MAFEWPKVRSHFFLSLSLRFQANDLHFVPAAISRSSGSRTLKGLQTRIDSLAAQVVKSAKASTPEYFEMFKNLIDQPFLSNYDSHAKPKVDESLLRNLGSFGNTEFDEPFSDRCYSMLLDNKGRECPFSTECFGFFSEPSASGKNSTVSAFMM